MIEENGQAASRLVRRRAVIAAGVAAAGVAVAPARAAVDTTRARGLRRIPAGYARVDPRTADRVPLTLPLRDNARTTSPTSTSRSSFVDPALGLSPPYDLAALRESLPPERQPLSRTYTVRRVDLRATAGQDS